jgi:hypothetical protein
MRTPGLRRNPFLGREYAIKISSCIGRFMTVEWLIRMHSEYWTATLSMRTLKLLIEGTELQVFRTLSIVRILNN